LSSAGGVHARHSAAGTTPHIEPPSSRSHPSDNAVIVHEPAATRCGRQAGGVCEAGRSVIAAKRPAGPLKRKRGPHASAYASFSFHIRAPVCRSLSLAMSVPSPLEPRSIPMPLAPLVRSDPEPELTDEEREARNRRRLYRVTLVNGPLVRVEVRKPDGTKFTGIVEDCCWTGTSVRFGPMADPLIRVDQVGVVIVASGKLPDLKLRARVATAERLRSGGTRYGLQFLDEDELHSQVTREWRRWFSRRRIPRFELPARLTASLFVSWRGGETRARVVDASLAGLGVEMDVESARAVVLAREVGLRLQFPGSGGAMRLRAGVRGTGAARIGIRVGLEFMTDTAFEGYRERLAAWTEKLREAANAPKSDDA
jgi:hypothetical protein